MRMPISPNRKRPAQNRLSKTTSTTTTTITITRMIMNMTMEKGGANGPESLS